MKEKYIEVEAISSLPNSRYLYEAQIDLTCAQCGATIPVNSFFARKVMIRGQLPVPCCRGCRPFEIYTSILRTDIAHRDKEYLYVTDVNEEVGK